MLSDPEKRKIYDKFGLEGLQQGGGAHSGDLFDIFNMFGGGGGGPQRGQSKMKKNKAVKKEIKITLENAFKGDCMKIPHTCLRTCETCDGKGGSSVQTCGLCKGKGLIEKMVQLGPGMYQHVRSHCGECRGEGKSVSEKDKCKKCKGAKVLEVKKVLEVPIEKGIPDKHTIQMHGEGDELPGVLAGDLYLTVHIEEHPRFARVGADLIYKKKISLLEALTGFNFVVEHLDQQKFVVSTTPGEIVSHSNDSIFYGFVKGVF